MDTERMEIEPAREERKIEENKSELVDKKIDNKIVKTNTKRGN